MTLFSKVERIHFYSPLRYPGGKSGLLDVMRKIIRSNHMTRTIFIEPYAGGAGVALGLLLSDFVDRIVINDLDPAIFAFWTSVIENNEEFIRKINCIPLTIEEWSHQKKIATGELPSTLNERGFATFFLNRTNRSGVLNAGPIGGLDQLGKDKINARFNRSTLAERVRLIGAYGNRITLSSTDGVNVIDEYSSFGQSLIYADPPYYVKGATLYYNSLVHADHKRLARALRAVASTRWVLTYDDAPEIQELYEFSRSTDFRLTYSAHKSKKASERIYFSDGLTLPFSVAKEANLCNSGSERELSSMHCVD